MLPMLNGENPVGVVAVNWVQTRPVPEDRARFAVLLCELAAGALARILQLQNLQEVTDRLPVGAYRSTADGRLIAVNNALVRILGYPHRASLLGTPVRAIYADPNDRLRWQRLIERRGTLVGYEVRWRRFDGTPIWVRESARAVRGASGQVVYYEGTVEDITERKGYEERVRFLAEHDPLTGIFNRRRFEAELTRRLGLAQRTGRTGAILLTDLDNFKAVNDLLGHQAGDRLLQELAALMRSRLRRGGILARLGGDEFGVVLFPAAAEHARAVAGRILGAIRERMARLGDGRLQVGASCGIAVFPGRARTVEQALAAADRARYAPKDLGDDQTQVWTPDAAWFPNLVRDELARALTENGLEVFAQPILDLRTGRVTQYELLARIRVGEKLLTPAAFLEAAERLGLIVEVDLKVLAEAVRLAKETALRLHVNISGRTMSDRGSLERMLRLLEWAEVEPNRLVLEITEQRMLADLTAIRGHLTALRERGYRLALDDFGAGFSSFHYLRHVPVDYVRVDGRLIRNLPTDGPGQKVVQAIGRLARDLGGATVAEWVEDEPTLRLVRELGLDYAQGFHIGVPVPLAQISEPGG